MANETKTTFGVSQMMNNAPIWWKRLESAILLAVVPGFTGFILAIPMTDAKREILTAGAVFFSVIVKAVGIFLGEEPTTTTASDDQTKK